MGNITIAVPMSRPAWAYGSTWTENPTCVDDFCTVLDGHEMYLYATSRSTPSEPRWRAYVPTDFAMPGANAGDTPSQPADLYWVIMRTLVATLHEHGFRSEKEITDGKAPVGAKRHGPDPSVWRPEAKIYLSSEPLDPNAAMSLLIPGEPIRLARWIDRRIDDTLRLKPGFAVEATSDPALDIKLEAKSIFRQRQLETRFARHDSHRYGNPRSTRQPTRGVVLRRETAIANFGAMHVGWQLSGWTLTILRNNWKPKLPVHRGLPETSG